MHRLRFPHNGVAWLEVLLTLSLVVLTVQFVGPSVWSSWIGPILAEREKYSLRSSDFPDTHISLIHLDLTSPHHWVTLTWSGPHASDQETGPFHSSPGAGLGFNDCKDPV